MSKVFFPLHFATWRIIRQQESKSTQRFYTTRTGMEWYE